MKDRLYIRISKEFILNKHHTELKEIIGHCPELFPDVARVAKEKGMDLECFISSFTDKYCI
jgi:hypothetical protein